MRVAYGLLAVVVIAAATPVAAARRVDAPTHEAGVFRVEFYRADGFEAHRIKPEQYDALARTGHCAPRDSGENTFPRRDTRTRLTVKQIVCEEI